MESSAGELIILDKTESTNNYAMGLVQQAMAGHGDAIFAKEQIAGKGRLGKAWSSNPGENITMSLIIKPSISLQAQFQLSAAVAVGCHKLLTKYIEGVKIKWPNDLYIGDRKAGGILIENLVHGNQWLWAIAGVGINVNQASFDDSLPNPVSLKILTSENYDTLELARKLKDHIYHECNELATHGFHEIFDYYNLHLYKRGEKVRMKKENAAFETNIIRVLPDGRLEVHDVMERTFSVDEIKWEIPFRSIDSP